MKILMTGPAGFIGSKLLPMLLNENHEVIGVDNLTFGYNPLIQYLNNQNFTFINADIREFEKYKNHIKNVDAIIHLAAIVGFPACKKQPQLAEEINLIATKKLIDLKEKNTIFLYASTCSNYGHRGTDQECNETTELKPLSLYGTTKTESEAYVREKENALALRIATAFGVSPRIRLDLLVNNFIIDALENKKIEIFESFHRRSFIHVYDIAKAFVFALNNYDKMKNQAFNVGDKKLNVTKLELAQSIQKFIDFDIIEGKGQDADHRDYIINFEKINKIGFQCELNLNDGIEQTVEVLGFLKKTGEFEKFKNFYKNI